ncbi:KRI1-like family C-terminal-domain-containing protein [Morchella snyderi]|nr:KRI1-like family C-terminal-domain-containing protein [Morchella snyderi]
MSAKPRLIDDSDSDSDSDAPASFHSANETPPPPEEGAFKINAEYARRFEHNKRREELHRLEEKYANEPEQDSDTDTDSEDEDDNAALATLELDREINATLAAIRKKDPRVYDGKTTFYAPIAEEPLSDGDPSAVKSERPITLKDYHLRNLLSGTTPAADDSPPKPKTFVQEQADLKSSVVRSMHAAAAAATENSDDDDAFLTRKSQPKAPADAPPPLPDLSLADKNPDEFLNQFLSSRAWAAGTAARTPALLDDDSSDDETAEAFEKAYNFRFENPDVESRGTLVSYSRDAVSTNTVRREDKSARKVAREHKRQKREAEAAERAREMGRLRKLKMDELLEKVRVLQEAAGIDAAGGEAEGEEAEALESLLEGEWTEERVDEYIAAKFGDEYYQAGKADKPVFEDDIDIDDIVPGFEKEEALEPDSDDDDDDDDDEDEDQDKGGVALPNAAGDDAEEAAAAAPPRKRKSKKEAKNEERNKKQKTKELKRKLEKYVDDNYDFEAQLPAGGGSRRGFRYRETTPETYGLTSLDILAATDQDLNTYVGLKRLAAFREPEKKRRDRKRYGKKKRLREWRKEVFGDEKGVRMPEGGAQEEGRGRGRGRGEGEGKEAGVVHVVEGAEGGARKRRKHKA